MEIKTETVPSSSGYDNDPGSHLRNPKGRHNAMSARVTGCLILCGGVFCIVLAIAQIVLETGIGRYGAGIWCSVLIFIPCGTIGVMSSYKKDINLIITYLVLSILTAAGSGALMIVSAISASATGKCYENDWQYDCCSKTAWISRIACDSVLSVVCLVELIFAIVASSYCCSGLCCACCGADIKNMQDMQEVRY
ncbi:uncharacterized protein LOC121422506 isoform X2 [Lytechinus variegatus]|uniref:uncharacterized protein LOC121422506 isoform X2 n=1 Tax=Lytechinus variegatus TaxID=7654 RepID=UPI001BB25B3C|nr:uncharacterized protein LOC121422506 isoform X2 [Lytechinus variegatus]